MVNRPNYLVNRLKQPQNLNTNLLCNEKKINNRKILVLSSCVYLSL